MLVLTLRTDKPLSELGLYSDKNQIDYIMWEADRKLAETINVQIKELLDKNKTDFTKLDGVVAYKGPGSFTGLRIGLSVANAIIQSLNISIVSSGEENWINEGIERLMNGQNETQALPEYGALPHITTPKK